MRITKEYREYCNDAAHAVSAYRSVSAPQAQVEIMAGKLANTGAVLSGTFRLTGKDAYGKRFTLEYGDLGAAIVSMSGRWGVQSIWHIKDTGKKLVAARW